MKISFNNITPIAKLLIGIILISFSVFWGFINKYSFIQGVMEGGGAILILSAIFAFFYNRKSTK